MIEVRRKYMQRSPERGRVWSEEPPPAQQSRRKVAVVYYLCRNRHLEHPHFIEVSLSSSEGLYLRDVIYRLNVLRGKGMSALYSWSCKRNYKNGFVWQDLCEDDLILPAHGNEYVLKGSELESPSDHFYHNNDGKSQNPNPLHELMSSRSQETSSSSSSIIEIQTKPSRGEKLSLPPSRPGSSQISAESRTGNDMDPLQGTSAKLTEYKVYKLDRAANASTQTDDRGRQCRNPNTCTRGVSTDEGSSDLDCGESHKNQAPQAKNELGKDESSPPPSSSSTSSGGKMETLESLIRADINKSNSFRILEEEQIRVASRTKLKASHVLMQLISCGSITVKDHHSFGLIPMYRPRFTHSSYASPMFSSSMMLKEVDCLSENARLMGLRLEEKEYFSGSLIGTKPDKDKGEGYILKRSSSYNSDRSCIPSDSIVCKEKDGDCGNSNGVPRSMTDSYFKHLRNELKRSPLSEGPRNSWAARPDCSQVMPTNVSSGGSTRITCPKVVKRSSKSAELQKENEKSIKIEERLSSGARVIIQSKISGDDSEGSSSS